MRYQQYKNRMLKIRKVIDFFYRFRFVFAGVITAIVAGSIALDVSRGSIVETSNFKVSYTYGEKIEGSGSAFMSKVTFEYRRKGEDEWSEEAPKYAGEYEARARSEGNHGYKYSEPYTFEIKPYVTSFAIKDDNINFGDDSPELTYELLPGDHIDEDYVVHYEDLTENKTNAELDVNSIKIYSSDNVDVTDCYEISTEPKEITFTPSPITFNFEKVEAYPFVGNKDNPYSCDDYTFEGNLYYGAQPVVTGGSSRWEVGSTTNVHNIAIVDDEGNDYTKNYSITRNENTITVKKAESLIITTSSMSKEYDGQPFAENSFTYSVSGIIDSVHEVYDVEYINKDVVNVVDTIDTARNNLPIENKITYKVRDKVSGNDINPSDFYSNVAVNAGTISISPIPISITTPDVNHYFDNKLVNGYEDGDVISHTGDLLAGDFLKVISDVPQKEPGQYTNAFECGVFRKNDLGEDVDVSSNYTLSYQRGSISIEVKPIVIKFFGQTLDYNGYSQMVYQNSNQGQIVEGDLPAGWTYSATVKDGSGNPFTMKNALPNTMSYQADETNVDVTIWDENLTDMTSYYTIDRNPDESNNANCTVTFIFEKSYISKVPLAINVSDFGSMVYNNKTFAENFDPNNYVTSVGLVGEDEVKVSVSDADKAIINANDNLYNIGLNVQVLYHNSTESAAGNYDITYNRAEPIEASLRINKKHIVVHTPYVEKVYDGYNTIPADKIKFTDIREANDIDPITDLEVSFVDKVYAGPKNYVSNEVYDCFSNTDLIISQNKKVVHNWDDLNNYTVDLIEDGYFNITARPFDIYQDSNTTDYIYYDEQEHGFFVGSNEIVYSHEQKDAGLLESLGHTLQINNPQSRSDAGLDQFGDGYPNLVNYFGVDIVDSASNSVKSNYEIHFFNDYIRVNIVKKIITISSGSDTKVFDGEVLDIYSSLAADEWVDIKSMKSSQFTYNIQRYDENTSTYYNANLDDGHVIQVKKTKPSALEATRNVGIHPNEFEYRVVDASGNVVNLDHYIFSINPGTLETKKLTIDVFCDNRTTEYNSANISYPNGSDINASDYEFNVGEDYETREQGAYLSYKEVKVGSKTIPFNKTAFKNNFYVKADITKNTMANYYSAQTYTFNVGFAIHNVSDDTVYTNTSNVELSRTSVNYTHNVTKTRIELKQTILYGDYELRVLIGTIKGGDVLYFGSQKYTVQLGRKAMKWDVAFDISNVHIYRNDNPLDDVTDCYEIIM